MIIRLPAGFQVTMILLAVGYMHYPNFVVLKDGSAFSLLTLHAPDSTLSDLGVALIIGSFIILPSLFYLYYSFRQKPSQSHSTHQPNEPMTHDQ